jgi:aerobic C4-dicarboxylate transport protein
VASAPKTPKPLYRTLWFQVLVGMAIGVLLGHFYPSTGAAMKPLGDAFIKLIKMIIAPIIFVTVVGGICKMSNMKEVGRIGVRALVYFEVASTLALLIGLVVAVVFQPGAGFNADPATLDVRAVAAYGASPSAKMTTTEFLMDIVPTTIVDAFAKGHILQIMLFSILFGLALLKLGEKGRKLVEFLDQVSDGLFATLAIIMNLAPIGTFGAMAFAVGAYGIGTLVPLGKVVVAVYVTCVLFILLVLGAFARLAGFRILKFLAYLKEEILIVLATSTSEVVLPRLMTKLEQLGCRRSVVGLVVPTGYSFNQDGSAIYQTIAALFIAQAMNIKLSWGEIITFLLVLKVTSKAAAGVSGSAFVALAATLSSVHTVPVAGMALLLGIERFMSMARGTTNMIGNGVATIVVARWDNALDVAQMNLVLGGGDPAAAALEGVRPAADTAAVRPTIERT